MQQKTQAELSERILGYLNSSTTAMTEKPHQQPTSAYVDTEIASNEHQLLFREKPLLMGLSCELPEPGDYLTNDLGGMPILLIRQQDGSVRAMLNICQHRGARLLAGRGQTGASFRCPYHSWRYTRDGALDNVPFPAGFPDTCASTTALTPLPVVEAFGLIWVTPTSNGVEQNNVAATEQRLNSHIAPLADDLEAYALDHYHHFKTEEIAVAMNWKLVVDTFLETYHLQSLHKDTIAPYIQNNIAAFDGLGDHLRMVAVRTRFADLAQQPPMERDLIKHASIIYVLFPNTVFIMQGDHLETLRVYPGSTPNQSRMQVSLYTPEPFSSDSASRHWENNFELLLSTVQGEDFPLSTLIQQGFATGELEHITFGRNEPALTHFHLRVDHALKQSAHDKSNS